MSFYGQVLQEFTRMFSKIYVDNVGQNSDEIPSFDEVGDTEFQANERWDKLKLKTGNKWIHLNGNLQDSSVTISHAAAGEMIEGQKVFGIEKCDQSPEEATLIQLKPGDIVSTSSHGLDAAGHLSGDIDIEYYKLPSQIISISEDDNIIPDDEEKFHFEGDDWILLEKQEDSDNTLVINHKTPEDKNGINKRYFALQRNTDFNETAPKGSNVSELQPGEWLTLTTLDIDGAGHVKTVKNEDGIENEQYKQWHFKLPVTKIDETFSGQKQDIAILEAALQLPPDERWDYNSDTGIATSLDGLFTQNYQTIYNHAIKFAELEPNILIGDLKNIYNTPPKGATVTSAIGILDKESKTDKDRGILQHIAEKLNNGEFPEEDQRTLSWSFKKLTDEILKLKNSTGTQNAALTGYDSRLTLLEKEVVALKEEIKDLKEEIKNLKDNAIK